MEQAKGADESLWEVLERRESPRLYPANQMIYRQGELAERFYYLKSGRVRLFLSSENGQEKTLTLLEQGNIFGEAAFFDGLPRVSSARTLEKSQIIPVSRELLLDCFREEPLLALQLLHLFSKTVRMLSNQVDHMTFLQADRRIAKILTELSGGREELPVACSHEDLASMAGVSRVTVSRALGDFAKRGWLTTQYRQIKLLNLAALSRFAVS
jgi:CRP-like cAMP-binding protein